MSAITAAKDWAKGVRRKMGLTRGARMVRELRSRGVDLSKLDALEMFGRAGDLHTLDYADKVRSLEIWEIDPVYEEALHRNLPKAKVKIVDSYEEFRKCSAKFGLIVLDNPSFIHGGHCENFDLFPDIYRLATDQAVLLINVIPFVGPTEIEHFSNLGSTEQKALRAKFYGVDDPMNIPAEVIERTYRRFAESAGFRVDWTTTLVRSKVAIRYLIQHVTRVSSPSTAP